MLTSDPVVRPIDKGWEACDYMQALTLLNFLFYFLTADNWCKYQLARKSDNTHTTVLNPKACQYCLEGALLLCAVTIRATDEGHVLARSLMAHIIIKEYGWTGTNLAQPNAITSWNDKMEREFSDIRTLIESSILLAANNLERLKEEANESKAVSS